MAAGEGWEHNRFSDFRVMPAAPLVPALSSCPAAQTDSKETVSSGNIFLQDFSFMFWVHWVFLLGRTGKIPHGPGFSESTWVVQHIVGAGEGKRYR